MQKNGLGSITRICAECGRDSSSVEPSSPCPTCGGATRPVREDGEPGPGRTIGGKYILLRWLGRGGFGAVFAARDPLLEREVAVKVLHVDFESKPDSLQRFYAEARNTSKLQHPHNVKVFDFGHTPDGLVYIVMELVHGRPLSRTERPMDPGRAVRLLDQAARALADAHSRGLVHRDLKPDNVMVTSVDGKDFAKVLDYGISKLEDSSVGLTGEGGFVGTPAFTSPEQVRGRSADRRSDIYCFGLLAYDLLAGRPPFTAEDPIAVAMMQIHDEALPLREAAPGVSAELGHVVTRCLQKDPAKRFQDMMAVSSALEHTPEFGLPDIYIRKTAESVAASHVPTVTVSGQEVPSGNQWADVHSDTIAVDSGRRSVLNITLEPVEDDTEAAPVAVEPAFGGGSAERGRRGVWVATAAVVAVLAGVSLALLRADHGDAPVDASKVEATVGVEQSTEAAAAAGTVPDAAPPDGSDDAQALGIAVAAPEPDAADALLRSSEMARVGGMAAGLVAYRSAAAVAADVAVAYRATAERSSRRAEPGERAQRDESELDDGPTTDDGAASDPRAAIRNLLGDKAQQRGGDAEEQDGVRDEIRDLLRE